MLACRVGTCSGNYGIKPYQKNCRERGLYTSKYGNIQITQEYKGFTQPSGVAYGIHVHVQKVKHYYLPVKFRNLPGKTPA